MNANDILLYGHETVVAAIDDLPDDAWERPNVCGVWSVKEIIAHLASFEHLLVEILEWLDGKESTPMVARFLADQQAFNDVEVGRREEWSVAEVWTDYEETYLRTLDLLKRVPPEEQREKGILPWYGDGYDLEDFLVYTYYGHKREHRAQIAVFQDLLAAEAAGGVPG